MVADRYRLVTLLSRGGFSEVWQAEDVLLGRPVAVKIFTASASQPDLLARFHREARTVAGLRHPNIVVVFDAGIDSGAPYAVMELLSGPSLDELLAAQGPLPVGLALSYAEQAAAGLAAAHAAGVIHRDIKPANLVLDTDGRLKVVDFGIARLAGASQSLTAAGITFGTPAYLSPEQAAGYPAEPRSDLYALGCVLYALLAGEPPFIGEHPVATAHQHLTATAPAVRERRPDVPPAIDQFLTALLAKDPRDRPPDAATVRGCLAQLHATAPPAAPDGTLPIPVAAPPWDTPPAPRRPPRRRHWPLAVAGGAVIALLLIALAIAANAHRHPAPITSARRAHTPASQPHPSSHRRAHRHHAPVSPAAAVAAAERAIVKAQDSGALQPKAATDLDHRLADISKSLGQGNLKDAGHKVGDLLHHLSDLAHSGQISARGLAILRPAISELARLLPQQP